MPSPRKFVSDSPKMQELFASVERVANAGSTILIRGETGTGKSTLAQAIHDASPRASAPFVVFDCASVAPTLIESELFGHEKGAFTGANAKRSGAIETAGVGTLFIDEVSELPLALQPKLLRAIEERNFKSVGSDLPLPLRCRIIVASQEDLQHLVDKKTFRGDLYYRIAVIELALPPLRERREDLPRLIDEHLAARGSNLTFASLSASAKRRLLDDPWRGNIRELRNVVERMLVAPLAPSRELASAAGDGAFDIRVNLDESFNATKAACVSVLERAYLARLKTRANGNVTQAAQLAKMSRRHLYELIEKHDFKWKD